MDNKTVGKLVFVLLNVALAASLTFSAEIILVLFKAPLDLGLAIMFSGSLVIIVFVTVCIMLLDLYVVLHGWDSIVKTVTRKRTKENV